VERSQPLLLRLPDGLQALGKTAGESW
jgi:hypothetical protein